MNIIHINCNYMGTVLHQNLIEQLDLLTKNTVFCPVSSKSEKKTKPHKNVIVSECFLPVDKFFFYLKQVKIYKSLKSKCDLTSYDCTHAYTLFTDGNAALRIKKEYGIPYVVAIRNTDLLFFEKRIFLRKRGLEILNNASKIFFLAGTTRKRLFDNYVPESMHNELNKKSFVVPNGIDDFWLKNIYAQRPVQETLEKLKRKEIDIICVAQIIKRKNIPMLQKAIHIMENDGWKVRLSVIGRNVDKEECEMICSDKSTFYHDQVDKEKLIGYYRKADIFVLASKSETFGLVYAEAMSQGLPVIYTQNQGFDGQFSEGSVGYHVNCNEPEDIADKICKAAEGYEGLVKNCVKFAERFDWKDIADMYLQFYLDAIK